MSAITEETEKERIFKIIEQIIEQCKQINEMINKSSLGMVELPNIGITYNNKIVEIVQIYRRKGISFYLSSLEQVINAYFLNIVEKSLEVLSNYIKCIEAEKQGVLTPKDALEKTKKLEQYINQFKELDNKLFYFDMEKDISLAIQHHINYFKKIGETGGYDLYASNRDEILNSYNNELSTLGFKKVSLTMPNEEVVKDFHDEPLFIADELPSEVINTNNHQLISKNDILKKVYLKIEELKYMLPECPCVVNALESRLIDYVEEYSSYYSKADLNGCAQVVDKIVNFDISSEIVDSVGREVSYWQDVNSFHGVDGWQEIKEELVKLKLENIIPTIENNIAEGKYQLYVDHRNQIINDIIAAPIPTSPQNK